MERAAVTDVLIVGGGVAGSSLALHLGRLGLEVELLERGTYPREKACGEGLMPAGVAALGRLGVEVEGARFRGVRYHLGALEAAGAFPRAAGTPAYGLGIRRRVLDEALFRAASRFVRAECGVRVEGVVMDRGRVAGVKAGGAERRARLVVAADGVHSPVRNALNLSAPVRRKRTGVRAHFRLAPGAPAAEWVDIHLEGGREIYVTPLPRNEVLVAMLAGAEGDFPAPRSGFAGAVRSNRAIAALLEGAEQISEAVGMTPLAGRAARRVLPGLALLGDAAGFIDPVTGGGMSQALLSAELLAAHLARKFPPGIEELEAFDRARERLLADYRILTAMVLRMAGREIPSRIALRALRALPGLFSYLVGVSGGVRRLIPVSPAGDGLCG